VPTASIGADGLVPAAAKGVDHDADSLTDRFELARAMTDPDRDDSDWDGIHDGLEDPDGDRLSNAGEQRFGTDPRDPDTDKDGRDDWHEDRDRDGRPNGLEQDAGPLPDRLRPSLHGASGDLPGIYFLGCHSRGTGTVAKSCTFRYGPKTGRKTVVLTGDSHAAHWFPALQRVARHRGWRLVTITRPACPVADVVPAPVDARSLACRAWRHNVWRKIRALEPDLIIASSLARYRFRSGGRDGRDDAAWQAGLTRSLRQLRRSGAMVLMLGDVYPWGDAVIACLRRHADTDISVCERTRGGEKARLIRERDKLQRAAARDAGTRYRITRDIMCPNDPCPVVVDGILMTRDGKHITATYSREVWRALDRIIPDIEP
jgi:hypothetical protein